MSSTPRLDSITASGSGQQEVTGAWEEISGGEIGTLALAAWGIAAHADEDAGNDWLVIARDQSTDAFPGACEPQAVLYLYDARYSEDMTVDRVPELWHEWRVMVADANGEERHLITRPLEQLAECVASIAEWVTDPLPTAGSVLIAALAEYGIAVHTDGMSPSYVIPLDQATPALEVFNRAHLTVADGYPSVEHHPLEHGGWIVFLHDQNSEPVGEALYAVDSDEPVDCTADSAAAAAVIAAFIGAVNWRCRCCDTWNADSDRRCIACG